MTLPINQVIRFRRGTASRWFELNPVLRAGEPGFESDTGKFKIGNGVSDWEELPYYVPASDTDAPAPGPSPAPIEPDLPAPPEGTVEALIYDHVNDSEPHPIYDDGPSLVLLYENAKV